jgi:hypothetical protein
LSAAPPKSNNRSIQSALISEMNDGRSGHAVFSVRLNRHLIGNSGDLRFSFALEKLGR